MLWIVLSTYIISKCKSVIQLVHICDRCEIILQTIMCPVTTGPSQIRQYSIEGKSTYCMHTTEYLDDDVTILPHVMFQSTLYSQCNDWVYISTGPHSMLKPEKITPTQNLL